MYNKRLLIIIFIFSCYTISFENVFARMIPYHTINDTINHSDAIILGTVSCDSLLAPGVPKGQKPDFKYSMPIASYFVISINSVIWFKPENGYEVITSKTKICILTTGEDVLTYPRILYGQKYLMYLETDKDVNHSLVTTYSLMTDANVLYLKPSVKGPGESFLNINSKSKQEEIDAVLRFSKVLQVKDETEKIKSLKQISNDNNEILKTAVREELSSLKVKK